LFQWIGGPFSLKPASPTLLNHFKCLHELIPRLPLGGGLNPGQIARSRAAIKVIAAAADAREVGGLLRNPFRPAWLLNAARVISPMCH
jgi:hypothetical protein